MEARIKSIEPDRGNVLIKVEYYNDNGEVIDKDQHYVADKDICVEEVKSIIKAKIGIFEEKQSDPTQPEPEPVIPEIQSKILKQGDVVKSERTEELRIDG